MLPLPSLATHSDIDGHETPVKRFPLGAGRATRAFVHALAPPVGSVEVRMVPLLSPATHSNTDAHETALRPYP